MIRPLGAPLRFLCAASMCAASMLAGVFTTSAAAQSVADFYRGKVINLIVGFSAGGGYDSYARTLAPYLTKHIPGKPTITIQNLSGAGSLKATQYLYSVAPRDGLTIGTIARGEPMEPLIGNGAAKYDARQFTWLGSGTDELSVCAVYNNDKIRTWSDALKTPFTVAGEGSGADADIFSRVIKKLFNVKLRLVTGYPGAAEMVLAMERGEVDGRCGWSWSTIKASRPQWIVDKKLHVFVLLSLHRSKELPDAPSIMDFATSERQKEILTLVFSRQTMGRPFLAPPHLPADRAAALRQAFDAALADPAFLSDAAKRKMEVNPVSGAQVDALLANIYKTPPDVLAEIKTIIASDN